MNYFNLQQALINPDEDRTASKFEEPLTSRMQAKMRFLEFMRDEGISIGDDSVIDNDDPLEQELRLSRKTMEKQMENDFGCDFSVARYALLKVEYRGVDEATEYIFGGFDQAVMSHPFFGYTSGDYQPVDNEQ